MDSSQTIWPTEIKVTQSGACLNLTFESGESFALSAEYLRVMSPSAEVQGHSRKERKTLGGKSRVLIIGVEPVGTYAVRLSFDDLHSTGLYTWTYLHGLGVSEAANWAGYLADLETAGLARDRPGEAIVNSDNR
jgi:DUF971 family protein